MLGKTVIRKPFIAYVKKAKEEKKEEVKGTEYIGSKNYDSSAGKPTILMVGVVRKNHILLTVRNKE